MTISSICRIIGLALLLTALTGCTGRDKASIDDKAWHGVGMYYWRTSWQVTPEDSTWIQSRSISRIYMRLFDVVLQEGKAMPSATIKLPERIDLPGVEIVPVVFVDVDVLRKAKDASETEARELGRRIATRCASICRTHHLDIQEIQIDCDWTAQTEKAYWELLDGVKQEISSSGCKLSSTIRLHQLAKTPPPVDYGVLMLYNTGDLKTSGHEDSHNPILDERDVTPYLQYLSDYKLPLTVALPDFSWQALYEGKDFKGILYGINLNDKHIFVRDKKQDIYYVIASRVVPLNIGAGGFDIHLSPGQHVKVWRVDEATRQSIKCKAEQFRPSLFEGVVYFR